MALIDRYVPHPHFQERHTLRVHAPAPAILAAASAFRPEQDPFFRRMIAVREAPMRLVQALRRRDTDAKAAFGIDDFTLLATDRSEIVFGLIGQFWRPDFGLARLDDPAAFLRWDAPCTAKLALNFATRGVQDSASLLSTETRIFCVDGAAKRRLAPYWHLIRPISGLIRRRILKVIANDAHIASPCGGEITAGWPQP